MANHVVRLYALAVGIVVFFVLWTVIASHPFARTAAAAPDPRLVQLAVRERRLRREAALVNAVVRRRYAVYRVRLRARETSIAAARARHARELAAVAARTAAVRAAYAQLAAARVAAAAAPAWRPSAPSAPAPASPAPAASAPAPAPAAPVAAPAPAPPPPPVAVVAQQPIAVTRTS